MFLGSIFASGLSGIVTVQCIVFFKLYPQDSRILKSLVIAVWILDLAHSSFVISAMWDYLIAGFGKISKTDFIPETIALSVIFTAILTFLAQWFFAHRIYRLSNRNVFLTGPILILALGRLVAASVSGGEMITLKSFTLFKRHFKWLFSVGLALSSTVDILVTFSLFFLLQRSRKQSLSLNEIIDALVLYTFEIGSLTSAATVISMICWLTLENNLVFLGLHFVIGKLYANSLLATLNARQEIGRSRAKARDLLDLEMRNPRDRLQFINHGSDPDRQFFPTVEVNVEKTVQFDQD
ncbi:hypothetical protein GALMADRAFT_150437 [Galerina marginata CBS 339.88]|uniref:DUF6534 domain-containing protein n=1 Tax=Galerina marginata (strain CBS 339.88) TaxID=685588 RepID=A0A067U1H2_GALM3|nr:hypothetical protein GALMADRAFT_150437 [Galerina marginata CBS 339.88]